MSFVPNYAVSCTYKCRRSDGTQEFVDFELGTLPDGTKLSSIQQLVDGDVLQLSIHWQGDVSTLTTL